jgi:hypothetical protein
MVGDFSREYILLARLWRGFRAYNFGFYFTPYVILIKDLEQLCELG